VFFVAFALSLAAMLLWSLASPLGSAPDEPSHFIRAAAVVRGQLYAPAAETPPGSHVAVVPRYVADTHSLTCFAFRPDVTASCQRPPAADPAALVRTTETAQSNSPAFYAVVGLPSLFLSGTGALYAMRAVNSLLCALMVGFIFLCIAQFRLARWAHVGAFVALTPMVLYLGGSINPNGLEAVAAGALFSVLLLLTTTSSTSRLLIERLIIVVLATAATVSTRSISLLWILIALGAALLFSRREHLMSVLRARVTWGMAGLAALVCVLSLLWFLRPPAGSIPAPPGPGAGTGFASGFLTMIGNTFTFGSGWIGTFGWLDTPSPALTLAVWGAAVLGIVVAALAAGRGRAFWAVVLLAAAVVLTPAISQAAIVGELGYIWQGRYILAATVMLSLVCGFVLDGGPVRIDARTRTTLVVLAVASLGVAQVVSFGNTLKRYTVGAGGTLHAFLHDPQWQPPGGWLLITAAFVFVIAGACVATIMAASRDVSPATPVTPRKQPDEVQADLAQAA
jgi:hypothetical protein